MNVTSVANGNLPLHLQEISKSFDGTQVLKNVSFTVPQGGLTVLLGPSGCGKSTLLRLIAGFETCDHGTISIGTKPLQNLSPAKRDISMVFQNYALFPHLTVAENIIFGLKVRKLDKAEQQKRLQRVAQLMGLAKLLERKPSQLSGGQQQRVALARAIVSERPICLMDEPLSNLDAKLRNEMRNEIRALQQQLGLTMIYVTHDQVEAITMADQIVLMNEGKVNQAASPHELYEKPQTIFCAQFIGTPPMNIMPLSSVTKRTPPVATSTSIDQIMLGVRPENVDVSPPNDPMARAEAKIIDVEYLGADRMLTCVFGDAKIIARMPASKELHGLENVSLSWKAEDEHYFDNQSGNRIEPSLDPYGSKTNTPTPSFTYQT